MANYRETLNLRQMMPNLKLSNPSWSLQGAGSLQEWTPNFPFFPLLMFNLEKIHQTTLGIQHASG